MPKHSLDNYLANRDLMKTGDMIEWRSDSIVGKSIRFFTKKQVNHTSTLFVQKAEKFGNEPHICILEAEPDGYEDNRLSISLQNFKGNAYWYPLKKEYDNLRNDGIDWLLEQKGKKYDFNSLFTNILVKANADARKLFCSEAHFFYLVISGILKQFYYDVYDQVIRERKTGKRVKAPVPGSFDIFNIYEKPVLI